MDTYLKNDTKVNVQTVEDTGWIKADLLNGWENYRAGYDDIEYRKINNTVYIRGFCKNGTSGAVFNLPVGFCPKSRLFFIGTSATSTLDCRINIGSNGAVVVENYSNSYVGLYNVSFIV